MDQSRIHNKLFNSAGMERGASSFLEILWYGIKVMVFLSVVPRPKLAKR